MSSSGWVAGVSGEVPVKSRGEAMHSLLKLTQSAWDGGVCKEVAWVAVQVLDLENTARSDGFFAGACRITADAAAAAAAAAADADVDADAGAARCHHWHLIQAKTGEFETIGEKCHTLGLVRPICLEI